ncbi:VaFE repeat-containing surface-anchored protein [[Clostridium] innocuum]|nr:VaFE repeat-containing surface-anchored protein [[Clostridium] innocuum]MCR0579070.1 VaFE repeat-containing surface-anchored protein [[Clostridium] innocuum]
MKKKLKRLLTGMLTLATVFTALPASTVHASGTQYWTDAEEKAGYVEKVMNDGSIGSTFHEGIMKVEGEMAYCVDINTDFQSGYKTRSDASSRMSADQIADVALSLEYVKQYGASHTGLNHKQLYLLEQCVVWQRLSVHLGWQCDNVRASYDEISKAIQDEVYAGAKAFVKANKGRYECGGYIYTGNGQDIGQFWAKLNVGNAKLQKVSSNTSVTNDSDVYSLAGAVYGVYSDKNCQNVIATLTTDSNGNTEAIEVKAGTVFIKEQQAPAGFKLDKKVYPLTVEAGKTASLKVSDTPKVTETLIELFKIDLETGKANAQGNASLAGAEFTWNYYDGYYNKDNLPAEPTRTWTTQTLAEKDSDGTVHYVTRLADKYKVSGDNFYTQNGINCLPLGTLTVEETKAPTGYLLEGAYMQANGSTEQIKGMYVTQITEDGDLAVLSGSNQHSVSDKVIRGGVKVQKRDLETKDATPQGSATLNDTEFTITSLNESPVLVDGSFYKKNDVVKTIRTGADGIASTASDLLPYGTYRIDESKSPQGYLATGVLSREFEITENGKVVDLTSEESSVHNQIIRGGVKIQKRDLETKDTKPQGGATLENTEFTITSLSENPVLVDGKLYGKDEVVKTIYTGVDGIASTASDTLPYGKYRIDESKAPEGYLTAGAVTYEFEITENGKIIDLTGEQSSAYNQIIRGGVKIQKRDLETKDTKPQGGATLKDTEFTITSLNENAVLVGGKLFNKNEVVKTIHTGIDGIASTASDTLPYGKYRIDESKAPEGYLRIGAVSREFEIKENGKIVDLTGEQSSIYNQIKRGDIEGVKIGAGTHKRLADVPFKITSKTTGESHIVVTDKNGQFSTASNWASHKHNTNAGKTSEDGVWFGTSEPDDSKGALLYDTYEIEELRCASNKGFKLIPAFDIVVSRDRTVIDLGTLTDEYEKEISIHTTATSKGGEKSILAGKEVTIVDTVKLDGLVKGTKYQLKGWQMLKEENAELVIDGKRVESEYTFTADSEEMKIEIEYTFNASELGGKNLVTFEELYDLSNPKEPVKVAEHKDIEDDGQTVLITERIINIHTTATSKDGEKVIEAGKEVTIIDTVKLDGLEIGTKYQLKGWQMIKEENAELVIDGKRVENDYSFVADSETMEVQIVFTFDASKLGGKDLVTFEELYDLSNPDEPKKVTEHKDIEDKGQTVSVKEKPETPAPEEPEKPSTPDTPVQKTDSPKTGDTTNIIALLALLGGSGIALAGTYFLKKRKAKKS